VISALLKDEHTPATELNTAIPARLSAVIDRALAKEPENRYQSMPEMIAELRQVVGEFGGLDRLFTSSDPPRVSVPLVAPQRPGLLRAFVSPAPVYPPNVCASDAQFCLSRADCFCLYCSPGAMASGVTSYSPIKSGRRPSRLPNRP